MLKLATIGPPAKRLLNGISLAVWVAYFNHASRINVSSFIMLFIYICIEISYQIRSTFYLGLHDRWDLVMLFLANFKR